MIKSITKIRVLEFNNLTTYMLKNRPLYTNSSRVKCTVLSVSVRVKCKSIGLIINNEQLFPVNAILWRYIRNAITTNIVVGVQFSYTNNIVLKDVAF